MFWREADRFLSRYSWSIEYFLSIKASLFSKLYNAASKNMEQEAKNTLIPPAFGFWLENGSTSNIDFGKMLQELNLTEDIKERKEVSSVKKENAISRAEEIIKLDKKRKQNRVNE